MKHIRNGRLPMSLAAAAMVFIALLSGCAHNFQESRSFDLISGHLERGGTVYSIVSSKASVVGGIDRTLVQLEQFLSASKLAEAEKSAAQSRIAAVRTWCHLAGVQNIQGIGASSVADSEKIFSNRIFLAVDPDFDGILDRVFRPGQSDVSAVIKSLPQETFIAAGADVSGTNILKMLSSSGSAGEKILQIFPPGFPVEILTEIEGWLVFALARDPILPPEDNCFMLQIPDPEGKVFALASTIFNQGKTPLISTRLELPIEDEPIYLNRPVIKKADGKLLIYSSPKSEELFEKHPNGTLNTHEDFVRYARNIGQKGSFFTYSRNIAVPGGGFLRALPGAGALLPIDNGSGFGVWSRRENGWLWQENSDQDVSALAGDAGVYQFIGKMILPEAKKVGKATESGKVKAAKPAADRCPAALKKLYAGLLKYAAQNQNKFPEFAGKKSLKQVFPKWRNPAGCRIFYFGSPDKKADYPLAVSCHVKEKDSFCVLYADGKVRSYKLERAGSCRRIISFLYTVHRWEAKLFQHLIKQAQQLDEEPAKKE